MAAQAQNHSLADGLLRVLQGRPVLHSDDTNDHAEAIDHAARHTRTINDFVAAEVADMQPEAEPVAKHDVEPHGMYWERLHKGAAPILRAHPWFYKDVSVTAEQVLAHASATYSKDSELRGHIQMMGDALKDYVQSRTAINDMAGKRKIKQETDDACYQLCQSAKYYLDAIERTQYALSRGISIDDNKQIERLRDLSNEAMREGYAIAQAVIRASDTLPVFDFNLASKRVVDYSCRKLTEWFAAKHNNNENQRRVASAGAAIDIASFLKSVRG